MATRTVVVRSSRILEFLRTEEASGVYLLVAAVTALAWVNSAWSASYHSLWGTTAGVQVGNAMLGMDLRHWVNEGLMTFFFFAVALEIKREVVAGELRDPKKLAMPAIAAVGGMIVPAAVYLSLNFGTTNAPGWGIPVATDIAFALGVLAIAGSRAPLAVRSFLLALAIVDDIGAILVIAVFYSQAISIGWLLVAVAIVVMVVVGRQILRLRSVAPFALLGVALWLALYYSGIHPTIAGVVLALLAPAVVVAPSPRFWVAFRQGITRRMGLDGGGDDTADAESLEESISPIDRVETPIHMWSTRAVAPAFALANAGVVLDSSALAEAVASPVGLGVLLGLVIGKPLGIAGATWLGVRSSFARLPEDMTPQMLLSVAVLAGIGFTVALFITELAFATPEQTETSKLAVLLASVIAGAIGAVILRRLPRHGPH